MMAHNIQIIQGQEMNTSWTSSLAGQTLNTIDDSITYVSSSTISQMSSMKHKLDLSPVSKFKLSLCF